MQVEIFCQYEAAAPSDARVRTGKNGACLGFEKLVQKKGGQMWWDAHLEGSAIILQRGVGAAKYVKAD